MRSTLHVFLVLLGLGGAGWGALAMSNANGAVQEIEGLIGLLICTVAVGTGYIVTAIDEHRRMAFPHLHPGPQQAKK